jgi:hypothetical protein
MRSSPGCGVTNDWLMSQKFLALRVSTRNKASRSSFRRGFSVSAFFFAGMYFLVSRWLRMLVQLMWPSLLIVFSNPLSQCRESIFIALGLGSTTQPDAMRVIPYSRFGNNVIQLSYVLYYSHILSVRFVYIRRHFLFINSTVCTTDGVTLLPDTPPSCLHVVSGAFSHRINGNRCGRVNHFLLVATFRHIILQQLPHPPPASSSTFAHLRAGDIFLPPGASAYGQPPCAYYLEALNLDNATDIRPVAEDMNNPCLARLLNDTGASWRARSLRTDVAELIYSHRMVLARGTFGSAVLFLSPWTKTFYTMKLNWPGFGSHFDCVPTQHYEIVVLKNWTASQEQIQLMMIDRCKEWRFLRS